jgi:hypothetical protein
MANIDLFIGNNYKYKRISDDVERDVLAGDYIKSCRVTELLSDEEDRLSIQVDDFAVAEIVERVRMRKLYFYIYHTIADVDSVDEIKIMSLYAFWTLKFHPFFWKEGYISKRQKAGYEINAKVALNLFLSGIKLYADAKTKAAKARGQNTIYTISFTREDTAAINDLYYSFCYRDWSKESLMDFAKSLIIKVP